MYLYPYPVQEFFDPEAVRDHPYYWGPSESLMREALGTYFLTILIILLKGMFVVGLIYLLGHGFTIEKEENNSAQIQDEKSNSEYMVDSSYTQGSGQNRNRNRGLYMMLM